MSNKSLFSILDTLAEFGIELSDSSLQLITNTDYLEALKNTNAKNNQLTNDSRDVNCGDVFCAIIGSQQSGAGYIKQAINAGAIIVLSECSEAQDHGDVNWNAATESGKSIAIVSFYQLNFNLFALAKAYYQQPQQQLTLIGVTGTNGKTSTSQLIATLLDASGNSCAVIGTNGAGNINNIKKLTPLVNTTPGATKLCQLLAQFVDEKIDYVAMEVSSHALSQRRVTSDIYPLAVFTNLSRDHLDYHETMANYAQAKRQLFAANNQQVSILNGDDEIAQQWLTDWPKNQKVMVYGRSISTTDNPLFAKAENIEVHAGGVSFLLNSHKGSIQITSKLIGDFNIDNLLAAISVLIIEKHALEQIAALVKNLQPILGRMESFSSEGLATAVVDYAHTPDALKKALQACRQHCEGDLWVVFGCGGDRDKGKRPLMGNIAETFADRVIITNDNPRNEDPKTIVDDIIKGCQMTSKITVNLKREEAVLSTLAAAKPEDMVLLAGKGHEDYVIIGDQQFAYDERNIVNAFYQKGAVA